MAINNTDTIQGFGTISVDLNNNGVVNIQSGLYEINANLLLSTGTGHVNINSGGTLQLDKMASGNTVTISDATGILTIPRLGGIANTMTIVGPRPGDRIQIPNVPAPFKEVFSAGTAVISNHGTSLGTQVFGGTLPTANIVQNALTLCFAAGGRIATPDGPVAVEDLKSGDRVLMREGTAAAIEWEGSRRVGDVMIVPVANRCGPERPAACSTPPRGAGKDLRIEAR